MDHTQIRPYAQRDLHRVLEIWEDASRSGHPFLSDLYLVEERDRVRDLYLPMATTWVFEHGSRVVGFISLIDDEVGGLFVEPQSHRRGIGRALMDLAMAPGRALELEVFKENSAARAFYERCGFTVVAEYGHADTGRRMLRMRRDPERAGDAGP